MFCPKCGSLAYPNAKGFIRCPNGNCLYDGHISGKDSADVEDGDSAYIEDPITGKRVDLMNFDSASKASSMKHLTEVIDDSQLQRGVLTTKTYTCPKCDSDQVFAELQQTRSSDEPETRILTCKDCGKGWREY
ncbi:MAG: RPA12/RPB9/RPC11 RNA polymerase family protein [Candidatus Thalassarchaeaceae archaeon]|jgi:DNA-directed RNA polymerase subunit M|nr:RPA12/RPB9/RPC11 RNA polymerase family protein [Candidatus Thalassarchaeaceae archaeon]